MTISLGLIIIIYGLPLFFYLGIATFVSLITTAVLGMLVLKGKYNIPFSWHLNMARVTIVIAIIHATFVMLAYFS